MGWFDSRMMEPHDLIQLVQLREDLGKSYDFALK
jgi:hypothetical protein